VSWTGAITFAAAWQRAVAEHGGAPFLSFESPDGAISDWTYAEFDGVVARMATELSSHGVGPGSAVHLALANCPTFVAVWLATTRLGAWIVPSDPFGRAPELADQIERTQPAVGFCAGDRADVYASAAPELVRFEIDEADATLAWLADEPMTEWPQPGLTDRAAVMFTSGTTGRPKGVEISQANYAFAGATMAAASGLLAGDRQLVVLPMFHANAQYYSFASAIWVGASVALIHGFSASGFLSQVVRHGATAASLFAAPIRMILTRSQPLDGVALRHCWFAMNISDDQYETLAAWLGCRPRQLYGMTETIPAVLTSAVADVRPDSMGSVSPGCVVDVQRPDGTSCDVGEEGEIVVGGEPGITLFMGYLDDPTTTAASFRDGWFLTGDRATRDAEGRHMFAGRRSDVLKVAGENVSTVEVEQCLSAHPDVLEASVVGVPDPVRDEVPVAFVVPVDRDHPPAVDELLLWVEARLGKAKHPYRITLLDELPRTSVGKIRKFVLKAQAESAATSPVAARDRS
jgi:carnitine-CoA ligase